MQLKFDPNDFNIHENFCCTTDLCNQPKNSSPGTTTLGTVVNNCSTVLCNQPENSSPGTTTLGTVVNSSSQVKIFRPFLIAFAISWFIFNN